MVQPVEQNLSLFLKYISRASLVYVFFVSICEYNFKKSECFLLEKVTRIE